MTQTLPEFRERLAGTWLQGRDIVALVVPESPEVAFAVEIDAPDLDECWRSAASLAQTVGRPPVVVATCGVGTGPEWRQAVEQEDFFSRFEYTHEPGGETSPAAIVRATENVDPTAFLLQLDIRRRVDESGMRALAETHPEKFTFAILNQLDDTRAHFGAAPAAEDVIARIGTENADNAHALEQYLLNWELAQGYRWEPHLARQEWFDASEIGRLALLFLPVACSWDALAYMHWFGVSGFRSASAIALGRSWQKRYGAELVAHFGTMLQCVVANPPSDVDAAWKLACEQDLFSPSTRMFPGTALRHCAHGLIGAQRWFFHERP